MTNQWLAQFKDNRVLAKILKDSKVPLQIARGVADGQVFNECLFLLKKSYKNEAFANRKNIKFVVAPYLKAITQGMFRECSSLTILFAPEVERIAERGEYEAGGPFHNTKLKEICFPKVKSLGKFVFSRCPLREIKKDDLQMCQEIGEGCFYQCEYLEKVCLQGAIMVKTRAFYLCERLTQVNVLQAVELGDCFSNCDNLARIDANVDESCLKCTDMWCTRRELCPVCKGELKKCFQFHETLKSRNKLVGVQNSGYEMRSDQRKLFASFRSMKKRMQPLIDQFSALIELVSLELDDEALE